MSTRVARGWVVGCLPWEKRHSVGSTAVKYLPILNERGEKKNLIQVSASEVGDQPRQASSTPLHCVALPVPSPAVPHLLSTLSQYRTNRKEGREELCGGA
ncbi:unnamed protein product [Discosporangium mesarthrocarpum]